MKTVDAATVVIIGAGISGLSAAYRLQRYAAQCGQQVRLLILDTAKRAGGLVESSRVKDALIERGPESFLPTKTAIMELIDELGLRSRLIEAAPRSRRTLVGWRNKLHALPEGFVMFAPTRLRSLASSDLFSIGGKLRMAMELFIPPIDESQEEESVAEFVRRRLGQEALDRLAEPLVGGIYAGDPELLSASSTVPKLQELEHKYGSVIRGLWQQKLGDRRPAGEGGQNHGNGHAARFVSFDDGLQVLVDALVKQLPPDSLRLGISVQKVVPGTEKRWQVVCADGETFDADAVIVATPSGKASELLRELDQSIAQQLDSVVYNDAVVVNALFKRQDIGFEMNGSGFVVPSAEQKFIRACTFSSIKFPERAPKDSVVLRLYARDGQAFGDGELSARLLSDARKFLGFKGEPVFVEVARHSEALPQYTIGHAQRMLHLQQAVNRIPGLTLAGNAYKGVGIPDCISSGNNAAAGIALALFGLAS